MSALQLVLVLVAAIAMQSGVQSLQCYHCGTYEDEGKCEEQTTCEEKQIFCIVHRLTLSDNRVWLERRCASQEEGDLCQANNGRPDSKYECYTCEEDGCNQKSTQQQTE